jgi:Zn-dependent M28 family amino/carboxypeptidase
MHLDEVTSTQEVGSDLIPLQAAGVPVVGLNQDMSGYFDWHHTAADTLDKIDPLDLSLDVGAFATVAYQLAETPDRLPAPPPPARW